MKKFICTLLCLTLAISLKTDVKAAEPQDTYLSEEIQGYCIEIGNEYGVKPELLMAIIEKESAGKPEVENNGCVGLMQINKRYHHERMGKVGTESLYDPYGNILVGTDYLMELASEYEDVAVVLMVYNGTKNAEKRAEQGRITKYATRILERASELETIHDQNGSRNRDIFSVSTHG